ncbi:MAG: thiamine-phosphate kinase [Steroidobacteraceae bacterium]
MALGEFALIERFFGAPARAQQHSRGDVALGIGDDAALLSVPAGRQLVAALDTLVEGRHFLRGFPAASIGHRALAANLSDLAAMGAEPAWYLLALTIPAVDTGFLEEFARGMLALAAEHAVALVGGDTTGGPLTISVQALGLVEPGAALRRDGGRAGDLLYVSGTPGDAAAGLQLALALAQATDAGVDTAHRQWLLHRFHYPEPRVALGRALRGIASACIDVSDGLAADAGKLAAASHCGVTIDVERLPLSASLLAQAGPAGAVAQALGGGEDYELCFSVPPEHETQLTLAVAHLGHAVTRIGQLREAPGVTVLQHGRLLEFDARGFDHFATG